MLAKFLIVILMLGYSQAAWNVTCDYDLEGISVIIKYLPTECQLIYEKGEKSELYQASWRESTKFGEFKKKLDQYERRKSSTPPNEIAKQDTKLRFHIYNTAMLNTCRVDVGNKTDLKTDEGRTKKYYKCLSSKRGEMIKLIPKN